MLSHRCCLERPSSKLFQSQASLSTQPSAINFRVQDFENWFLMKLDYDESGFLMKVALDESGF